MKRFLAFFFVFTYMLCVSCTKSSTPTEAYFDDFISHANMAEPNSGLSLSERYGVPASLQSISSFANGSVSLNIDANITVPDVRSLPVLQVEKTYFSQTQASALFDALSGNHTWWYQTGDILVRGEVQQEMTALRETLSNDAKVTPEEKDRIEERLVHLESIYDAAPESTRCNGKLAPYESANWDNPSHPHFHWGIDAYCTETSPEQSFRIINTDEVSANGMRGWFCYSSYRDTPQFCQYNRDLAVNPMARETEWLHPSLSMNPQQAVALANEFLREAELAQSFQISGVYLACETNSTHTQYGYRVLCGRMVNGVMVAPLLCASGADAGWEYEAINIEITDEGIIHINWSSPLQIGATVVQDVALLPFDEIVQRFLRVIEAEYADPEHNAVQSTLHIDRIALTMQRISDGAAEPGLLIPAWSFYGTGNLRNATYANAFDAVIPPSEPTICINAIDGAVINMVRGY